MINSDTLTNIEYWYDDNTKICYAMILSDSHTESYVLSMTIVPYIMVKDKVEIHHFSSTGENK
jgi:hypothetical protein